MIPYSRLKISATSKTFDMPDESRLQAHGVLSRPREQSKKIASEKDSEFDY